MRKPYSFDDRSDRECRMPGCHNHIKRNVLAKQPDATLCWPCKVAEDRKISGGTHNAWVRHKAEVIGRVSDSQHGNGSSSRR